VAEHADEALPGEEFLFAERAAEVGDDDEVMRAAAFAKLAAAHTPAAGAAGERDVEQARGFAGEAIGEPEVGGRAAEDALGGLVEEELRGVVGEAELVGGVEGENRDVDFLHHGAEEGGGFEGVEALVLKRAAEGVDLPHNVAEGFVAAGAAGAHGEIALAEGGEEVGHRLQRAHDAVARGGGKAEPKSQNQQGKRPLDFRRGRGGVQPKEIRRGGDRGQAGEQRVEEDELVVGEPAAFGREHEGWPQRGAKGAKIRPDLWGRTERICALREWGSRN
jgi:hypothetical protein